MGLAVDAQHPDTLLAATVDCWMGRDTIWRSTDAGQHWESLRPRSDIDPSAAPFLRWGETQADFGWWMAGVAIDPFDSNHTAYTTGATVYETYQPVAAARSQPILWRPWVSGIEETAILTLASPLRSPTAVRLWRHRRLRAPGSASLAANPVYRSPVRQHPHSRLRRTQSEHCNAWWQIAAQQPRNSGLVAGFWQELDTIAVAADTRGATPAALTGYYRDEADAVVAVSADGATFIAMTQVPMRTRDRGRTLDGGARPAGLRSRGGRSPRFAAFLCARFRALAGCDQ